jgi:NAD(P)-dependent dehydrogenase (short-subunit alcohol dehydrogenase family)
MKFSFPDPFKALVVGSGGALGQAFARHLQARTDCAEVVCISRSSGEGFDLRDPDSIARIGNSVREQGPFHLIVDATGALTIDGAGPEKALSRLDYAALAQSFAINAIGPGLVLRQLAPLLASGDAVYAKLSARVGSIADNHKGGWYGYRASKAALNMILQTAAIELQRRNPNLRVVALQPGTVRSALSEPFQTGVSDLLEPDESVAGMMQAIMALEPKAGAHFIDYKGQGIPW